MDEKPAYTIKEAATALSLSIWRAAQQEKGRKGATAREGTEMPAKLAYTIKEAAKDLSIGDSLLKDEMYQGRIRYIKIGRRVVIPRWALEQRLSEDVLPHPGWQVPEEGSEQ